MRAYISALLTLNAWMLRTVVCDSLQNNPFSQPLPFGSSLQPTQDEFLEDLRTEIKAQNSIDDFGVLSCDFSKNGLTILCSSKTFTELNIGFLTLTSIPSSISACSFLTSVSLKKLSLSTLGDGFSTLTALESLDVSDNKLTAFPSSLASLTQMKKLSLPENDLSTIPDWLSSFSCLTHLNLLANKITSVPQFFSNFTSLQGLYLNSNSLTSLPNDISSLTSLTAFYLNGNLSLKASTDLFKEMINLRQLYLSDTLISGLLPVVDTALCSPSCVSSSSCTKNESCSCSSFDADYCPDKCGMNSQQLCVNCSSLVSQKQCSGDCFWCSGNKDGNKCYWCDLKTNRCSNDENCNFCFGHSTEELCTKSSCHWCEFEYCAVKADECEPVCSNLTSEKCETKLNCSWCSSYSICLDSTAQCLSCDRFTSSFCPPGCECPSDSNATVVIVVCVVCCVFLMICVCLFVVFVLKRKTVSKPNRMNTFSNSNTSLRFEDDVEMNETSENPIFSRYSECCVDSLFRVSHPILSFSSDIPLKLCSPVSVEFEMTNVCGMEIVVESFFVKGIKEKHGFVFSPSSFTIGVNEKRKICVSLTMNCSATLTPTHSFVCCVVSTKQQWCSLCGIQAQSELSPLLSCDDIELKRELGRGAFGKVFLGFFKGTEVAVKTYSLFTQENNEKEANIFSKLHSPHIVTFYGISQTLNAVIIEYCKYGSVERLYDRKEMTDLMRLLICYDCSLGMKYLHSNGILHRDLKPDNLLIVSFSKDVNTVRAKISDFGTSRFVNQTMKMTESVGTPSYMAPEVFNNESYGKKSDVYSFGLTAWAIYSKQTPYSELPNVQTIMVKVNEGYRPQLCQNCPLNDLIERCWHSNPDVRPSFDEITEILKQQI